MQFDVNNPYFRTKVLTASKEELRLMLIEGSLRFIRSGRDGLAAKNYEKVFEGFTNAKAIIMELMNTLDHSVNPELCAKLSSLYTYMFTRLTEGSLEKDLAKVDEVIGLMEFERETWVMLMEKLAGERAHGRDPVAEAAAALGRPAPTAPSGAVPAPFTPNFAAAAPGPNAGEIRPTLSLSA